MYAPHHYDSIDVERETAWDCDPHVTFEDQAYDAGLDEEDDEGDWQVIALDRFGDRMVNGDW